MKVSSRISISPVALLPEADIGRVLAAAKPAFGPRRACRPAFAPDRFRRLMPRRAFANPRGMLGHRLGVDMHMVTSDVATVRNLMLTVERSHLVRQRRWCQSPMWPGSAALADDEADLGAATVDMGAGTTSLAVFSGGHIRPCRRASRLAATT